MRRMDPVSVALAVLAVALGLPAALVAVLQLIRLVRGPEVDPESATSVDPSEPPESTAPKAYPVKALTNSRFFYTVVEAEIEFELDSSGRATAVDIYQNGHVRAPRD